MEKRTGAAVAPLAAKIELYARYWPRAADEAAQMPISKEGESVIVSAALAGYF